MIDAQEILRYLQEQNVDYETNFELLKNFEIYTFSPLKKPKDQSITWARDIDGVSSDLVMQLNRLHHILIICNAPVRTDLQCSAIYVDDPHKVYFKIISRFFVQQPAVPDISEKAIVNTGIIGTGVGIGAFSYIDANVKIGNHVTIGCNVTITGDVTIGDNTVIESGCVIGFCGFGFYKESDGTSIKIPHMGGVLIGHDCDIGANCTIARGTLSDTVIGNYVKIDAMCHVAHNVEIGDRVIMAGGAKIAGSTVVEEDVWIGGNVSVSNGLTIGKHSFIGIGSVVTKNILPYKAAFGVPARMLRENTPNVYTR